MAETTKTDAVPSTGKNQSGEGEDKKRKKKHDYTKYNSCIRKILVQEYPDAEASSATYDQLSALATDIRKKITDKATELLAIHGKKTMTSKEIRTAVEILFEKSLADEFVRVSDEAIARYVATEEAATSV